MEVTGERPNRNYGIDLLRIVAMLMICVLHVCNQGGILTHTSLTSSPDHYRTGWLLDCLTYASVNIYAMMAGYVGYRKSFKISRPLGIWLQLIFYSLIGTALVARFFPALMTETSWLQSALPVLYREYWFYTAYFGMVILSPLLNAGMQKMDFRTHGLVCLGILLFFSILPTVLNVSPFTLSNGFSTIWLCAMYVVGGYLEKMNKPNPLVCFLFFVAASLITWFFKINGVPRAHNYTSHTVVIAAAAIVLCFSQIRIRSGAVQKIIGFIVPSVLPVFTIHVHTLLWSGVIKDRAVPFLSRQPLVMALEILASGILIFVFCFAVDLIRRGLFRLLRVRSLLDLADRGFSRILSGKPAEKAEDPQDAEAAESAPETPEGEAAGAADSAGADSP